MFCIIGNVTLKLGQGQGTIHDIYCPRLAGPIMSRSRLAKQSVYSVCKDRQMFNCGFQNITYLPNYILHMTLHCI